MAWLEVETKIRIKNPKEIRKKIMKIARLVKKEKKEDYYFALKSEGYPKKAFRIRVAKKKFIINFKKWLKKYWSKDIVVKKEFEFEIKNKKHVGNLIELFKDLGFKEWLKKTKYSESYSYKKNKKLNIELNKVRHLGYFLEIEYLCQERELRRAKKTIREIIKILGINKKFIDNTGYTKMLYDKGFVNKNFKK